MPIQNGEWHFVEIAARTAMNGELHSLHEIGVPGADLHIAAPRSRWPGMRLGGVCIDEIGGSSERTSDRCLAVARRHACPAAGIEFCFCRRSNRGIDDVAGLVAKLLRGTGRTSSGKIGK